MRYSIEYAAVCNTGHIRHKNQDNLWCAGEFMQSENNGLQEPILGKVAANETPAFAIFDGMGGELQGEVAAHIAAESFHRFIQNQPRDDSKTFLRHRRSRTEGYGSKRRGKALDTGRYR